MTQGVTPLPAKYEGSEEEKLTLVQNMMDGVQLVAAAESMHLAYVAATLKEFDDR